MRVLTRTLSFFDWSICAVSPRTPSTCLGFVSAYLLFPVRVSHATRSPLLVTSLTHLDSLSALKYAPSRFVTKCRIRRKDHESGSNVVPCGRFLQFRQKHHAHQESADDVPLSHSTCPAQVFLHFSSIKLAFSKKDVESREFAELPTRTPGMDFQLPKPTCHTLATSFPTG